MLDQIKSSLSEAQDCLGAFLVDTSAIDAIHDFVSELAACYRRGNQVFSCGNGGSMCDASHFAEEWTGRFRKERPPMPALCLNDVGQMTCISNDYGYDHVFARPLEAFGRPGDVLLAVSTSGNSRNVLLAAETARGKSMKVVGLLGKDGGKLKNLCDIAILAPGQTTDRIQEIHIKVIHITIECVERTLFPDLYR